MVVKIRRIAALGCGILVLMVTALNGSEPLRLRVSPEVALAPGLFKVQTSIEADAQNRFLEVIAESSDFYRSSRIQLDGKDAPRLNVVEFRNLPSGVYQITAVLIGQNGPRASALRLAKVAPALGR